MATKSEINIVKDGVFVVTLFITGGYNREDVIEFINENFNMDDLSNEGISDSIKNMITQRDWCHITSVRGVADMTFNLFINNNFATLHTIEAFE